VINSKFEVNTKQGELLIAGWQKLYSFANFSRWGGLCDFQMCAMCVRFPNCPEGQESCGNNYFFLAPNFNQLDNIL